VVQLAEYQKIHALRADHAISDLILVDGCRADFSPPATRSKSVQRSRRPR